MNKLPKTPLGLLVLCATLFGQTGSQFYNFDNYFPTSSSLKSNGGGSSVFGSLSDIFLGHDTTPSLYPTTAQSFDFTNQIPIQGQSPFQPFQPVPPVDPATLTCGQQSVSCPPTRYRSYDGTCNNLLSPTLGTPQTPYARLLPPIYGDGVRLPTRARSGKPLPNVRTLSLLLFPDVPTDDPKFTLNAMQYGQIITHDMSMIAGSTQSTPHAIQCCTADGQLLPAASMSPLCFPIILPKDDPQTVKGNIRCMNFVRSITDRDRNCVGGDKPAEQLTVVNHFLDLSIVYGNTNQVNQQLRVFQGGRLRVAERNGKEWPPQNPNVTGTCPGIQSLDEPCYLAGDARLNQNPQLAVLQVILLREHNRLANALAQLNPHWNDETIFQEARRINIGQHQHIVYYEWLPIFLGISNSFNNKIIHDSKGFVNDYDAAVDPTIINEHATGAFRYFHVLIKGFLDLITAHRDSYGNIRMSDWFNRPAILEQGNNFDDLTRGLATQPEKKANQFSDAEITEFLFRPPNQMFGQDLRAVDIQRNRDHALASYNDFRAFCGLPKAHTFEDFLDVISAENVQKLANLYESPDDVDLQVGGTLERLVPGTLAGPVNLCILTEQFYRTRVGDRFFYENGGHNTGLGFSLEQLNEIRKSSISRILCDNGNHIQSMQPHGFERVDHSNAVVPCESLPSIDLTLWREQNVGGGGSHIGFSGSASDYLLKK